MADFAIIPPSLTNKKKLGIAMHHNIIMYSMYMHIHF